jgi:hypothetical protein
MYVVNIGKNKVRNVAIIGAAGILLLLSATAWASERKWTVEEVGRGITTSLVIDGSQNLHVAYLADDARVYYGFRPAGSGKWFSIPVVSSTTTHGTRNIYPRVTADKSNVPHLCVAAGTLNYVTLQDQKWSSQEIDPGSGTLSYHCSVAIGPDGVPHLSWYHEFLPGGKQFTHLRHVDLEDNVWVVRSIDGGIAGKWNSMVVDAKGYPHLSYSQWSSGGGLRYAAWDGTRWNVAAVDTGDEKGYDNNLVLAPDGSAHISYFAKTDLKYAHQKDGKWVVETIGSVRDGFDFYGGSTALVLDSHGFPHVIYGDFGAIKELSWDGKQWESEVIVSGGVQQYLNVDAAIGPDDTLYVSYPDTHDGMVKVAAGKPATAAARDEPR